MKMIVATMLFAPAPVLAQAAPAAAADPGDKIVCKTQKFVGSRISDRICKKRSEWDAARENAQRAMDQRQSFPKPTENRGNGGG